MKILISATFFLLLLATSCTTKRITFITESSKPVGVIIRNVNNAVLLSGTIPAGDSLTFQTKSNPPLTITASGPTLRGSLTYHTRNKGEKFRFRLARKTDNVKELSRSILTSSDGFSYEQYRIFIADTIVKDFGYLNLTSNENDVQIYLDGELIGEIVNGMPFNKKLSEGSYVLLARKQFFTPITSIIDVKHQDIIPIHFHLTPVTGWTETPPYVATAEQARGDLIIVTERNDYTISIEGVDKTPPFEFKNMPSGIYSITIRRPGFIRVMDITVPIDDVVFLDLDGMDN